MSLQGKAERPLGDSIYLCDIGLDLGRGGKGQINQQQITLKAGLWLAALNCHTAINGKTSLCGKAPSNHGGDWKVFYIVNL